MLERDAVYMKEIVKAKNERIEDLNRECEGLRSEMFSYQSRELEYKKREEEYKEEIFRRRERSEERKKYEEEYKKREEEYKEEISRRRERSEARNREMERMMEQLSMTTQQLSLAQHETKNCQERSYLPTNVVDWPIFLRRRGRIWSLSSVKKSNESWCSHNL
jgi:seryl-tRNA synthetase